MLSPRSVRGRSILRSWARYLGVAWLGYVIGACLITLITAIILALQSYLHSSVTLLYLYVPALLAAALWGYGPSLTTGVIASVIAIYFVVPPRHTFVPQTPSQATIYLTFPLVAMIVGWAVAWAHEQWERAELLSDQLESQAGELVARTAQLAAQNDQLATQNERLALQSEEMAAQGEEMILQNEELTAQGEEFVLQNEELEKARREADDARQRAQIHAADLEAVLNGVLDGVMVSDNQGKTRLVNPAMCLLIGAEADEIPASISMRIMALGICHIDGRPLAVDESPTTRALRGESVASAELQFRRPDGVVRFITTTSAPLRNEDGAIVGAVTTSHDVTADRQREARTRAVAALIGDLATVTDSTIVLERVTRAAGDVLDVPCSAVFLLNPDSEDFTVASAFGLHRVAEMPSVFLSANRSIAGRAIRSNKTIAIADVTEERNQGTSFPTLAHGDVQALIVSPIGGDADAPPIGVLEIYTDHTRAWTADEEALLVELANAAAVALHTTRRLQRETFLSNMGALFMDNLRSDQALATAIDSLADMLRAWCSLTLVEHLSDTTAHGEHSVRVVALSHPDRDRAVAVRRLIGNNPIPVPPETSLARALGSGQLVTNSISAEDLVAYSTQDDLAGEIVRLAQPRPSHELVVPLVSSGQAIGVLSLSHEAPGLPFSGEEIGFISLVANRIAAAIDSARFLEQTESERSRLRAVLDAMSDTVMIFDATGHMVEINRGGEHLFGARVEEIKNLVRDDTSALYEIRHPDDSPVVVDDLPWRIALRGEVLFNRSYSNVLPNGHHIDISVAAAPITRDDDIVGAVVVLRDISAEKALERQKDEFIGVASHELKTPITTIRGHIQILMRRLERELITQEHPSPRDERSVSTLNTVLLQVDRLVNLINDMLDLTRIQSGYLTITPQPTDLSALIGRVVESLRPTTERHTLRLSSTETPLILNVDSGRIEQVLDNLISNAIKYSPAGGVVEISLRREAGNVLIRVTDHGIGVPVQDRDHLFDRFYRVSNSTTHQISGLGLGLYVSQAIAQQHGGYLSLERSEDVLDDPDHGSTFCLTLPTD